MPLASSGFENEVAAAVQAALPAGSQRDAMQNVYAPFAPLSGKSVVHAGRPYWTKWALWCRASRPHGLAAHRAAGRLGGAQRPRPHLPDSHAQSAAMTVRAVSSL